MKYAHRIGLFIYSWMFFTLLTILFGAMVLGLLIPFIGIPNFNTLNYRLISGICSTIGFIGGIGFIRDYIREERL